jgi:hypothetical protein
MKGLVGHDVSSHACTKQHKYQNKFWQGVDLKILEIYAGRDVQKLKWAVGKQIKHATVYSRHDQQNNENEVVWVEIDRLFDALASEYRDKNDPAVADGVSRALEHWEDGGWMDPAQVGVFDDQVHFVEGRNRLIAARRQGALFAPVIVPEDQLGKFKELLGAGTVTKNQPLTEKP